MGILARSAIHYGLLINEEAERESTFRLSLSLPISELWTNSIPKSRFSFSDCCHIFEGERKDLLPFIDIYDVRAYFILIKQDEDSSTAILFRSESCGEYE